MRVGTRILRPVNGVLPMSASWSENLQARLLEAKSSLSSKLPGLSFLEVSLVVLEVLLRWIWAVLPFCDVIGCGCGPDSFWLFSQLQRNPSPSLYDAKKTLGASIRLR